MVVLHNKNSRKSSPHGILPVIFKNNITTAYQTDKTAFGDLAKTQTLLRTIDRVQSQDQPATATGDDNPATINNLTDARGLVSLLLIGCTRLEIVLLYASTV